MSTVKIHAGDLPTGSGKYFSDQIMLPFHKGDGWLGKTIKLDEFESVDVASEEAVKRIGGTVGWGAAGAMLLGPIGLLAGLIAGGKGKEVTFVAKLKDGRKMLASTDSKTFIKIQSAVF